MEKFPISFWNYKSIMELGAQDVRDWAECGMTLAMLPECPLTPEGRQKMRFMLDECDKYGMKCLICDSRATWGCAANPEAYRAAFTEAYEDFGKHPAAFGFHIGDEPSRRDMENVYTAFRIQREVAPELTPFLNLLPLWGGPYNGYRDIDECFDEMREKLPAKLLCYDRYSQMNPEDAGTEEYFHDLRRYSELSLSMGIPFWTTLLCVGHFRYRVPSEDDMRWQFSTAVASGCQGILWFMYYLWEPIANYRKAPVNFLGEKTETYYALRNVLREHRAVYGDIFAELTLEHTYHIGRKWGGYTGFENCSDDFLKNAEVLHGIDGIVSFFHDKNGERYIAIVNNSCVKSGQMALTFDKSAGRLERAGRNAQGKDVYARHHDEGLDDHGDTFTYYPWLAPGQLNLYKIAK